MPSKAISIRFTDDEHQQLRGLAKQHGQPIGAYVRARLFAAVHAEERGTVLKALEWQEKLLKAILLAGVESVNALRRGESEEAIQAARAQANERATEIIGNLRGRR